MRQGRLRRLAGTVAAVWMGAATCSTPAEAKCGYKRAVVKGLVVELGGAPVAGARVMIFIDEQPDPLFDREADEDTARTDAEGRFEFEGSFDDYARWRWWHALSTSVDICGREPETFTLVVQREGFFGRRIIATPRNARIRRTTEREYFVEMAAPIELLPKRAGA